MTDAQLLETIVKGIVADEEAVKIERTTDELGVLLSLRVGQDDMGKLIGRSGNTAKGIRTVLRAAGMKAGARVNVKILEPDGSEQRESGGSGGGGYRPPVYGDAA